jgi:hypothetical protein
MIAATSLLITKLYIPPPHANLVKRPRLIERLEEGVRQGCKLTLVSACTTGRRRWRGRRSWGLSVSAPNRWGAIVPSLWRGNYNFRRKT